MRYILTILGVLLVVGVLAGLKGAQIRSLIQFGEQAQAAGAPPEPVGTAVAKADNWELTLDTVGNIASSKGVEVSNDAPGVVSKIRFESGDVVKRGEVLLELDTRVERAQLASQVTRRDLAETTVKRTRQLAAIGAIAKAQLDNDESQLRTANAEISTLKAQIARKIVRAPFSGKLGIRMVNLGQYLNPGTAITVLEGVEGVYVDFSLPQENLSRLSTGMPVRVTLQGEGEGDSPKTVEGKVSAVDPQLDQSSRSIKLRASLPDTEKALRPGMFVDVSLVLPEKSKQISVPATAVVHASYGDSVFVVEDREPDDKGAKQTEDGKPIKVARQQFVKLGRARGDFVAVLKGLKAGEEVVSVGAFKLRNKSPIYVSDAVKLDPKLDPHPENR